MCSESCVCVCVQAVQQTTIEDLERMINQRENKLDELKESANKCQVHTSFYKKHKSLLKKKYNV